VRLDDNLADAHAALGAVRFIYDWDWKGAEAEFRRALSLSSTSSDAHVWYGVFLSQMGRFDEPLRRSTGLRRSIRFPCPSGSTPDG
jgi:Tfp pilus assembly protein PilF